MHDTIMYVTYTLMYVCVHKNVGQLLYIDCITVEDLSCKKNPPDFDWYQKITAVRYSKVRV